MGPPQPRGAKDNFLGIDEDALERMINGSIGDREDGYGKDGKNPGGG
jgi:hypothetical protein